VEILEPAGWPRGAGYAHGVAAEGRLLVTAGQIGWEPVSRRIVEGGFAAQTEQALRNVVAVVRAGGAEPADVVRLTWYVADRQAYLDSAAAIGVAYRSLFGRHYPAMAVVIVAGLLDAGAMVEIEATAVVPGGRAG
jgi:enamine deaminase RidA (YjgF/YER057c/UK114 family)